MTPTHEYLVEVVADSSGKWCSNGLRFPNRARAKAYARDLASRWMLVQRWRVRRVPMPVPVPVPMSVDGG